MTDKIKIVVEADTKAAVKNLDQVDAAAGRVASSGSRIGQVLGGISWSAVGGGVAAFGAAAVAATQFAAATEAQNHALNTLGRSYELVTAATRGTVTAQAALRAQQTLVQSGLRVSGDALAAVTRTAREYARATGTETTAALEELTEALRTNSGDALSKYGIAASTATTASARFAQSVAALTARQSAAVPVALSLNEELAKLGPSAMAVGARVLDFVSGPLDALFQKLTSTTGPALTLRQVLSELASAGDDLAAADRTAASTARDTENLANRERFEAAMRSSGARLSSTNQARFGDVTRTLTPQERSRLTRAVSLNSGEGTASELVNRELDLISGERLQREVAASQAAATRAAADAAAATATTGVTRAATAAATALDAFHTALAASLRRLDAIIVTGLGRTLSALANVSAPGRDDFSDMLGALGAPSAEALEGESNVRAKGEAAFAAQRQGSGLAREAAQRRATRDQATRRGARTESLGGRTLAGLGIATNDEGQINPFNAATDGAGLLSSALGTVQTGLATMFTTMASGSASAGEAFNQFATSVLGDLGKMAIEKGVFFLFEGIAAAVSNPVAAPGLLLAGGGLMALGAGLGAFSASAGAQAAPTPASPSSLRGLAPRSDSVASTGPQGAVTVVLSSLVPAGPVDAQRMRDGDRTRARQGFGDRTIRRIEN